MHGLGRPDDPGSKPEDTVFEQPSLDLMTAESRRRSLPSVAHVLATESVRRAALARFDSLEHCAFFERLPNGLINRNYDDEVALVLRDSGSAMMANLSTAMPFLEHLRTIEAPTDVQANALRQFDKMIDNFGKLVRLGIPMVCGNDAGVNETPFDSTWLEVVWMIKAGQAPVDARCARPRWRGPRTAHRQPCRPARKGYSADLIVLRGNPLDDAANLKSPPSSWRGAPSMSAGRRRGTPDGRDRGNAHAVGARPQRRVPERARLDQGRATSPSSSGATRRSPSSASPAQARASPRCR